MLGGGGYGSLCAGVGTRGRGCGPGWIGTERFDIVGVADTPGTPNLEQFKSMERKLVVERFGLKFHWETREMPAYVLTVEKSGARLTESKDPGGPPSFGAGRTRG